MTATLIGYARCSTDEQDLTAQRHTLCGLGVAEDRIYLDHGFTGIRRTRPGLDQALAAARVGDTLVVPKLDRLARSVPDAREIGDSLVARGVKLSLGGTIYDPADRDEHGGYTGTEESVSDHGPVEAATCRRWPPSPKTLASTS